MKRSRGFIEGLDSKGRRFCISVGDVVCITEGGCLGGCAVDLSSGKSIIVNEDFEDVRDLVYNMTLENYVRDEFPLVKRHRDGCLNEGEPMEDFCGYCDG